MNGKCFDFTRLVLTENKIREVFIIGGKFLSGVVDTLHVILNIFVDVLKCPFVLNGTLEKRLR